MTTPEYSQGVCADGAAILEDGVMLTIDQIVNRLNQKTETIADLEERLRITEFANRTINRRNEKQKAALAQVRALVEKWRWDAGVYLDETYDDCADELEAALASPPVGHQPKASAGAGSDGTGAVLDTTLTAAAMTRVANELAAAAANMSDEEDDFELGLRVYPPGIVAEDDDGTPSKHPVLAVFDAEYPEEGIYPVYLSGEQQPSLASPADGITGTEQCVNGGTCGAGGFCDECEISPDSRQLDIEGQIKEGE